MRFYRIYTKYKGSSKATRISALQSSLFSLVFAWMFGLALIVVVPSALILYAIGQEPSDYITIIMVVALIIGLIIGIIHAIYINSINTAEYAKADIRRQIESGDMEEETRRFVLKQKEEMIRIAYVYHKLKGKYEISEIIRQVNEADFNDEVAYLYASFRLGEAVEFLESLNQATDVVNSETKLEKNDDDYGYNIDNPILLKSVNEEDPYFNSIYYDKEGFEKIGQNRVRSEYHEGFGVMIDVWEVYCKNKQNGEAKTITLYVSAYPLDGSKYELKEIMDSFNEMIYQPGNKRLPKDFKCIYKNLK